MNGTELTGQISGGWAWVVATYSITLITLLGYGALISVRLRTLRGRASRKED